LNSPSSHSEGLALGLLELGSSHDGLDVMLNSEHSLIELSVVVLLNSLVGILGSLVNNSSGAQELPELISVELALLQFADLFKQSL
jgi:hypothetical protein